MKKQLAGLWRGIGVKIPPRYARSFLEGIAGEDFRRVIIGGAVVAAIEIGVFFSRGHSSLTQIFPVALVLFNLLTIPLFILLLKQDAVPRRRLRYLVYLVVGFYLVWACFYSWSARFVMPLSEVMISLYILMVFGAAVFIYMEPLWSACLFTASLGLFIILLYQGDYSQVQVMGHIWNATGLNLIAWVTSRLLFGFRMKTFVARQELEKARAQSDALLLNVLPAKIVEDLKQTGTAVPQRFDEVTVLFSDLVNFTETARSLSPEVIVGELNDLFGAFDQIVKELECERIKTIGDGYLCVCGMPRPHPRHAENILRAARKMLDFLDRRNRADSRFWQVRIGVHTGSVVAGIVGTQKYIYDVFGDTINIAYRLQQHAPPMQVNVSRATYERTREAFLFTPRKLIEVKGVGKMEMYFMSGDQ